MQEQFDLLHLQKLRCVGKHFPGGKDFEGICTAALYGGRGESIISIMADGYELGETPEKWINFTFTSQNSEQLEEQLSDFVIVK